VSRLGAGVFTAFLLVLGCASTKPAVPTPSCSPDEPADLGTLRSAGLMFLVLDADGVPVSRFWWRYRSRLFFPGPWSQWYPVDDEQCRQFCSCGYGGATDQEDGTYEVEICRPGGRTIRALIDQRPADRPGFVVLRAPEASAPAEHAEKPCRAVARPGGSAR
jgi:hypothetical protein